MPSINENEPSSPSIAVVPSNNTTTTPFIHHDGDGNRTKTRVTLEQTNNLNEPSTIVNDIGNQQTTTINIPSSSPFPTTIMDTPNPQQQEREYGDDDDEEEHDVKQPSRVKRFISLLFTKS